MHCAVVFIVPPHAIYARVSTRGGKSGAAQPRLMRGCGACAGTDTSYGARKTVQLLKQICTMIAMTDGLAGSHLLERVCTMTAATAGFKLLARDLVMYVETHRGDAFVEIRLHTLLRLQIAASVLEFRV